MRSGDDDRVAELAAMAVEQGLRIAVAESLTCGQVSTRLGAGPDASEWYHGAVVAYDENVKFDVLRVSRGPVVTDSCAREMASGVRRLMHADVGLGITGVGGPGPTEGRPAGTVHWAIATGTGIRSGEVHLGGKPEEVIAAATSLALDMLHQQLADA
jgi:nicotinamide-nucleotide amidase